MDGVRSRDRARKEGGNRKHKPLFKTRRFCDQTEPLALDLMVNGEGGHPSQQDPHGPSDRSCHFTQNLHPRQKRDRCEEKAAGGSLRPITSASQRQGTAGNPPRWGGGRAWCVTCTDRVNDTCRLLIRTSENCLCVFGHMETQVRCASHTVPITGFSSSLPLIKRMWAPTPSHSPTF